jgi:hypothetical protein
MAILAVCEEGALALDDGLGHDRRMVSKRCCMFLMNQRASCRLAWRLACPSLAVPPRGPRLERRAWA